MFDRMKWALRNRIKYSVMLAAPTAISIGVMMQHTGLMLWAFALAFAFHFIVGNEAKNNYLSEVKKSG